MRNILLGAAAAMAIIAPSVASADTNAVVGLQYSNTDFDTGDFDQYGLNGAFSHDLNNGAVFQMDGEMGRVDAGGCCLANSYAAAHYAWRNDAHAFGGFVGFNDFFIASGLTLGLEGEMYLGNFDLGGSIGMTDFDDFDLEARSAEVDGTYYFTPNLALNGMVAFSEAESTGADTDWTTVGIGGEWRPSASAFSFNAGYRNHDFDGGDADTWTVGLSWDLGTGSVQERSREGAGLDGARNMFDALSILTP